jgi:hypothetical protein
MRRPKGLDSEEILQLDQPRTDVVEEPRTTAEQHRYEVDGKLVNQASSEV